MKIYGTPQSKNYERLAEKTGATRILDAAVVDLVPSTQSANHRTETAIAAIKSLRARSSIARTASTDQATFTALREQGRRCSAKANPVVSSVG